MPSFRQREDALADELRRELETWSESPVPITKRIVEPLGALLSADRTICYGLVGSEDGLQVDYLHADRDEDAMRAVTQRIYSASPATAAAYDPVRPEPEQRNVALTLEDLEQKTARAQTNQMRVQGFREVGVSRMDQLRILVCEGESLLGWVGAFRDPPFERREVALLQSLGPALRRRLWLERQLEVSRFALAALDEALERVPVPAFVVRRNGQIAHANSPGKQRVARDSRGTRVALEASMRIGGEAAPFSATPLEARGAPGYFLAVERRVIGEAQAERTAEVAARWQLTPRQAQVLALLTRGYANKSIAAELQCSVKTVEVHLTALLRKAGVTSRAELLAQLIR